MKYVRPIHFISGLPRAGSTLLAALLLQNPAVRAGIVSPLGSLVGALLKDMSQGNETSIFIDDAARARLLQGLFDSYYADLPAGTTVFDSNRGWTARVDLLAPLSRVPHHLLRAARPVDHRLGRAANPPQQLRIVEDLQLRDGRHGLFACRGVMSDTGLIGYPRAAMKQAMHSAQSGRVLLLPYDLLTANPQAALDAIYDFCGLPRFAQDPENISFDTKEFDARLGTLGLHDVRPRVGPVERKTILPPDLWERWERASIWRMPQFNTLSTPIADKRGMRRLVKDLAQDRDHPPGAIGLRRKSDGATGKRCLDHVGPVVRGDDDHAGGGPPLPDQPHAVQATVAGQLDVEQDERRIAHGLGQGVVQRRTIEEVRDVERRRQHRGHASSIKGMVIDDEDRLLRHEIGVCSAYASPVSWIADQSRWTVPEPFGGLYAVTRKAHRMPPLHAV